VNINATLFAQMIVFAVLIWVTMKWIWPPLMAAIEERQQKIAEGLAAADRSKKDLAQAEEKVQEVIREARVKAAEIVSQAEVRRAQIIDQAKEEAVEEGNRQKAAAAAEIVSMGNRAREELRKQVSAIAVAGTEKLLKREIDANAHKALLDELASQI
jgi:F-type H+-transporting ATPase subunit b